MNLYNLHSEPESLLLFKEADEYILDVFFQKYKDSPEKLKKREKAISVDPRYAFCYAVLTGPFPAGEEAISKDAEYAYNYAEYVLRAPFPAGEAAIAKEDWTSSEYAYNILKKDFYLDGKLIAKFES